MQIVAPVGVGYTLGRPGSPRSEAQAAGGVFIEPAPRYRSAPFHRRSSVVQSTDLARAICDRPRLDITVDDQDFLNGGCLGKDLMRQFVQIGTQDQDPRAALGKHRGKLQGQEAWIERMADRAHADDPIPALEMGLRLSLIHI